MAGRRDPAHRIGYLFCVSPGLSLIPRTQGIADEHQIAAIERQMPLTVISTAKRWRTLQSSCAPRPDLAHFINSYFPSELSRFPFRSLILERRFDPYRGCDHSFYLRNCYPKTSSLGRL